MDVENPRPVEHPVLGHQLKVVKNALVAHRDLVREFGRDATGNHGFTAGQGLDIGPHCGHINPCSARGTQAVFHGAGALDLDASAQRSGSDGVHIRGTL